MPRIPTITKNLLIINILAFVGTLATRQQGSVDLNDLFGLHFFMASDFHVFQLVSYMFMHAGWEHLIFNMFMLWMFGTVVEHTWGSRRFIFITSSAVSEPAFCKRWPSSAGCITCSTASNHWVSAKPSA